MRSKRKGTDITSAPKEESTNYSRLSSISLFISYIGIIGFMYAYQRIEWLFWLSVGVTFATMIIVLLDKGERK